MKSGVPNLDDVARQAGVSKSTVSRVLNNRLGNGFSVKDEVRQRVIKTALKLNYRPNLIAKSLTMRSTRMIHIFGGNHALSELGNIYQTVVNNLTQVIDALFEGYDVTVDMSRHTSDASELPAWKIDGAIILAKCTPLTMDEITQMPVPGKDAQSFRMISKGHDLLSGIWLNWDIQKSPIAVLYRLISQVTAVCRTVMTRIYPKCEAMDSSLNWGLVKHWIQPKSF
jgi:AraC-like DNA-binding protein